MAKKEPYHSRYTGPQVDVILSKATLKEDLTQAEYDAKLAAGTIENGCWYMIYGDMRKQRVMRWYIGKTLVAQRSASGSIGFPYSFPIIF